MVIDKDPRFKFKLGEIITNPSKEPWVITEHIKGLVLIDCDNQPMRRDWYLLTHYGADGLEHIKREMKHICEECYWRFE